jgi:hypothetical protein
MKTIRTRLSPPSKSQTDQRAGQTRLELTERVRCVRHSVGSGRESWHCVDKESCRGGEQREEGEEMHR